MTLLCCRSFLLSLVLAAVAGVRAQTALPAGGTPLFRADHANVFRLTTTQGNADAAAVRRIDVTAAPGFDHAWQIETRRDLNPAWAAELRTPLSGAVTAGDVALVRFFARALAASDETGLGRLRVAVQRASPDYEKSVEARFSVGHEWQEFFAPFTFVRSYAAGAAELTFGVGFKHQTIEVGGVEVVLYGKTVPLSALPRTRFTYAGREPDAVWRREALARIEQVRKSDFSIRVLDASGSPVPTVKLHVEQRTSAFQFGTAIQFARLVHDTPDNLRYREKILELFNAASPENDLKWPVWRGDWHGDFSHEQALAGLRWLHDHGLPVRGHVLVWPGWKNLPKVVTDLRDQKDQAAIPKLVLDHIQEMADATRGMLTEWDVLNEPYDNHALMDLFGPDIMVTWYNAARTAMPGLPLYLNDYANHDLLADSEHFKHYSRTVDYLLKAGAPLGGLGLQGHISGQPNPPAVVLATLDRYAQFKLPIRFTEFDVNTDDEQLQADYTRDFLILAFSHPSVVGVQLWGFWERTHWLPQGAMYRNNWDEKPNGKVYRSLVLDQWRSRLDGVTGADGRFAARGFQGTYVVTAEAGARRAELEFSVRPGEPPLALNLTLR